MLSQYVKNKNFTLACALSGFLLSSNGLAEMSGRPDSLTLAGFQFGPENRWSFSHIREVLPTVNIPHDNQRILNLERSESHVSDFKIEFAGKTQSFNSIAQSQFTDGLIVLKDGKIVFEQYYGHLSEELPHLMMSVTKSVVGVLAGKLAAEGAIDLDKPVSHYVPALANGGWGPDSLRTLLDMRDGADYTEDYEDFSSTVRLMDCATGWTDADYCPENGPRGGYEFFPTVGRNAENLGKFVYKSGSTDVLGWVLESATGKPLATLISEYVWQPMGAEADAYITVDPGGFVLADGGMNSTLRDLARFGQLVLNDGEAFGEQVLPPEFIHDIQQQPGDPSWPYGQTEGVEPYYRSQWWGRGKGEGDIMGNGVHGQHLRVAPQAGIVVALYSTWPRAGGDDRTHGWDQLYELSDALVKKFR